MIVKLETELSKLNDIKKNIEEMGASLWQGSTREANWGIRSSNARKRLLGRYKKSRRGYQRK